MSSLYVQKFALYVPLHYWMELLVFPAAKLGHPSKRIFYIENINKVGRANNFASVEALYKQRAGTAHWPSEEGM